MSGGFGHSFSNAKIDRLMNPSTNNHNHVDKNLSLVPPATSTRIRLGTASWRTQQTTQVTASTTFVMPRVGHVNGTVHHYVAYAAQAGPGRRTVRESRTHENSGPSISITTDSLTTTVTQRQSAVTRTAQTCMRVPRGSWTLLRWRPHIVLVSQLLHYVRIRENVCVRGDGDLYFVFFHNTILVLHACISLYLDSAYLELFPQQHYSTYHPNTILRISRNDSVWDRNNILHPTCIILKPWRELIYFLKKYTYSNQ